MLGSRINNDNNRLKSPTDTSLTVVPNRRYDKTSKQLFESWQHAMSRKIESGEDQFLPFPDDGENSKPIFSQDLMKFLEEASGENGTFKNGIRTDDLLKEADIDLLYKKLSLIFTPGAKTQSKGFSLYDTKDEEGLHDGNTEYLSDEDYNYQSDYDIDEVHDDLAHHIEVEVDQGMGCDSHDGNCSCDDYDDKGPSCEFTFEYDKNGKLIPTSNNVEEQLRLMQLQKQQLQIESQRPQAGGKKKKNKKKNKSGNANNHQGCFCLFCEYQLIYGVEPRQMIKWYEQTVRKEENRRLEIKKKLEKVKSNVLKFQRENREQVQ